MKILLFIIPLFFLAFQIPGPTLIIDHEEEAEVLKDLLHEFLEGASYSDAEIHDRFWAEDLIYTSSAGERITKYDIMQGVTRNPDYDSTPEMAYHSEEVQINIYDKTAVVAFKLVGVDRSGERSEFYNTGTFVKADGEWRAVAWQATRIE